MNRSEIAESIETIHTEGDNRCEKGITLIALVITIIVLLILAGVALNSLVGRDSIIWNANKVAEQYNKQSEEEERMLQEINDLLEGKSSYLDEEGYLKKQYNYVSKTNANVKFTIPKNFALMDINGENIVTDIEKYSEVINDVNLANNGVIVKNKDGSEFVWVPVKNTESTGADNMYWESDGKKVGQLYARDSGDKFGNKNQTYTTIDNGVDIRRS